MEKLIFIVFEDERGGYSAVEGKYDLMVVGRDREQLINEIRRAVKENFGGSFSGQAVVREFSDDILQF